MTGRLMALGAAAVAAITGLAAAVWAKRRADEDASLERDLMDDLEEGSIATPGPVSRPEPVAASTEGQPADDLTVVKGIGAVSAARLDGIGVRTLAQVAAWTEPDIESVAARIKVSPERIRREDWVGQARAIAES